MLFPTNLSREFLEEKLSHLEKKNYNQFVWWRRYQQRPTLPDRAPLYNKIINGEYDTSDYYYQAEHENYLLEDATKHLKTFEDKLDKISLFRARYKKLHEDFIKEEAEIMRKMKRDFSREFRITSEELDDIMIEFDGTVLELYNYIKKLKGEHSENRKPMPKVSVS